MRFLKIIIAVLVVVIVGLATYIFLYSDVKRENKLSLKSKAFYYLIENYKTPELRVSVNTLKRNPDLIGKSVSVDCKIVEFKGLPERIGTLSDPLSKTRMSFIFMDKKLPDSQKWNGYLKQVAGKDVVVVMHGIAVKEGELFYFVPQRIFMSH